MKTAFDALSHQPSASAGGWPGARGVAQWGSTGVAQKVAGVIALGEARGLPGGPRVAQREAQE